MVKNAGSKNKRGRLMKNMKSPNSGLILEYVDLLRHNGSRVYLWQSYAFPD